MEIDAMTWGKTGKDIAKQLEDLSDEQSIKAVAAKTMQAIHAKEGTPEKRANALKMLNRELLKKFPRKEEETKSYYHDPSGKADLPKWRHLIFKYLTLDSSDWDVVGGEAREVYKAQNPTKQPETTEPTKQTPKRQRTRKPKEFLKTMTIEQLNLDSETQQTLEEALNHSGMDLEDFIKQAIKVYARTIKGKAEQRSMDLANVSTEELLNDSKWKTQPGRAEELTKRAIAAIVKYNTEVATENADRWKITQSAIASLTGSRPQAVGEILKQYQTMVDDHNSKPEYAFTDYSNRKPGKKITDVINLAQLIPNGID
jgi:hypothetical protein